MSHIKGEQNAENYLKVLDEHGAEIEDYQGLERRAWQLKNKQNCPFPGCSDNAWDKARRHMWSLIGPDRVLAYLKNHAQQSTLHCKHIAEAERLPIDKLDELLVQEEIEEYVDDFDTREAYRQNNEAIKKRKANEQWEQQHWRRHSAGTQWDGAGSGAASSAGAWAPPTAVDARIDAVAGAVQSLAASMSAMQQHKPLQPQQPQLPPVSAIPAFITQALTIGNDAEWNPESVVKVQERLVTIPYSQLLLIKETVQRSKEACKQSLASLLVPINSLRSEIGVMANAETIIQEVLDKATAK